MRKHFSFGKNFKIVDDLQLMILNIFADFDICLRPNEVRMGNLGTELS